jgi:hypothetical protein
MTSLENNMKDATLDRELERLLSIEPSAGFQARVRTRVTREMVAASSSARWGWLGLRAMAVAACIVLALVVIRWNERGPHSNAQAGVTPVVREAPVEPAISSVQPDVGVPTVRLKPDPRLSTVRPRADPTLPGAAVQTPAPYDPFNDVLVSANELKALRQAEALIAGRPLKEEEAPTVAAVRNDMTELTIAPITIEPIQLAAIKGDAE